MRICPVVEDSRAEVWLLVSALSQFEFLSLGAGELT